MVPVESLSSARGAIYVQNNAVSTPKRPNATRCVRLSSVNLADSLICVPKVYRSRVFGLLTQAVRRSFMCGPSLIPKRTITFHNQAFMTASSSRVNNPNTLLRYNSNKHIAAHTLRVPRYLWLHDLRKTQLCKHELFLIWACSPNLSSSRSSMMSLQAKGDIAIDSFHRTLFETRRRQYPSRHYIM